MKAIADVMATTGAEWVHDHPHDSYAPVRIDSPVKWWVLKLEFPAPNAAWVRMLVCYGYYTKVHSHNAGVLWLSYQGS